MHTPGAIMRLTCVAFLLIGLCCGPRIHAQQPSTAPSIEQQFFEAINKVFIPYEVFNFCMSERFLINLQAFLI